MPTYNRPNIDISAELQAEYDQGFSDGVASVDITTDNQQAYDQGYTAGYNQGFADGAESGNEPPPPPPPPASGDPYDLSGFNIPFVYEWPIEPTTTAIINVPADMDFASAVSNAGSRIVVAAGYTGPAGTFENDLDIVLDNSATITGRVNFGAAQRIRWTGGNINGEIGANGFTDLLLDNVNVAGTLPTNFAEFQGRLERLALINSTFTGTVSGGGSTWGVYIRPVVDWEANHHQNVIIANCRLSSNYQASRITTIDNLIIVDSVGFNPSGQSSWRIHHRCTNVFIENIIGNGLFHWANWGSDSGPQIINGTINNIHGYDPNGNWRGLIYSGTGGNSGTVSNSVKHWAGGAGSIVGISPFTDGGGNSQIAWDGSTYDWTMGGVLNKNFLSDFGADH